MDKDKTINEVISVLSDFDLPEIATVAISSHDSDTSITGKAKFMRHKETGMIILIPEE